VATLTFEQARERVLTELRDASVPGVEETGLLDAAGRVLAEDVASDRDAPALARSLRDGFAVRAGDLPGDVLVAGDTIAAIGQDLAAEGATRVVDAEGCIVLPGLVDPHTHIQLDTGIYRTPDDWGVGTRTAACR
jgi:molybdopterin biosynthesis enzyme